MEIILNKEAPPLLVQIIHEAYEGIETIEKVVIDAFFLPHEYLAAYDPAIRAVLIDVGHCMTNKKWMNKGALFIPNVWMNLIFAVHHELVHACQIQDNPELAALKKCPPELEDEANQMALDAMFSWFEAGGIVPPIREMGWIGEMIAKTLNGVFNSHPQEVLEEMEMTKTVAVAKVDKVISSHDHFNDIELLYSEIDKGNIGLTANGQRYLTATEFLAV